MTNKNERTNEIVKVGSTAAVSSIILALLEAAEGVVAGSLEMVIDGLSHISEAGGTVVTVIGAKLAGRPADRKHPFGYGRIEYLSALLIGMLTVYAGATGIVESIRSILHPSHPHYGILPLAIVVISMITRIVVGRHDIHVGHEHHSRALLQVGRTELKHSILSVATLLSAAFYMLFHLQINAWISLVISAEIVWSGINMLKDMVESLVGVRAESELLRDVKKTILEEEEVDGVFDLSLNNIGPREYTGSVHLGIADTLSMNELDRVTRRITARVKERHHVFLTGVGIYPLNTTDPEVIYMREQVSKTVLAHEEVKSVHGFYLDREQNEIRFDAVIGFETENHASLKEAVEEEVNALYPAFECSAVIEYELD